MPYAAAHVCAHAGCRVLVKGAARCAAHPAPARPSSSGTVSPLYDSAKWRAMRRCYLKAHPVCRTPGCGREARHADHITPHHGDAALFFDTANLQPLCHSCHSRKTASSDGGFGNPRRRVP